MRIYRKKLISALLLKSIEIHLYFYDSHVNNILNYHKEEK